MMKPLVSVGIPTYNRPDGLQRALACITAQTYQNLEIIVSDNASSDDRVNFIVQDYIKKDSRIQFVRQSSNMGALYNFQHVLALARGDFFLWMADDDERSLDCIEYYLDNINGSGAFFSSYAVRDYQTRADFVDSVPLLSGIAGSKKDLAMFFRTPCPSMIYGMFKTSAIRDLMIKENFDWLDCYLIVNMIQKYGYRTEDSEPKYYAGIQGEYIPKPADGFKLNPWRYFFSALPFAFLGGFSAIYSHFKILKTAMLLNKKGRRKDV